MEQTALCLAASPPRHPPAAHHSTHAGPTGAPRGARDATRRHGAAYACSRVGWKRLDERFSTHQTPCTARVRRARRLTFSVSR